MTHGPILVPLDGSPLAEVAVPAAATIALLEDRPIDLLAVVDPPASFPDSARLGPIITDGLRVRLHGIAEQLRADGLIVETSVRDGLPADVILAHAEERSVQLIVMTTRGLGGLERWLVGSVADKVMRLAPCPVVLFRPPSTLAADGESWRPKRLLVPLDGSELAEQAIPMAVRWASGLDAQLLLVRVEPWSAVLFPVADGPLPDLAEMDDQVAQAAAAYLEERRSQIPEDVDLQLHVIRGDPAGSLIDMVEREHIDLTIMTSRGRSGIRRLVLGSVADRLVRGGLPICLVHPLPVEA